MGMPIPVTNYGDSVRNHPRSTPLQCRISSASFATDIANCLIAVWACNQLMFSFDPSTHEKWSNTVTFCNLSTLNADADEGILCVKLPRILRFLAFVIASGAKRRSNPMLHKNTQDCFAPLKMTK
jgi:hypothetical protein